MLYSVLRKDSEKEFCMKCIPYVHKIFVSKEEDVKSQTQVLNEIQIMQSNRNDHIIDFKESYIDEVKQKVFVIMELMDDNMTNLIESSEDIHEDICKYILCSVLKGIQFLHKNFIIHNSIKSSNIMFNMEGKIKIIDYSNSMQGTIEKNSTFCTFGKA
jgi:serine/threonine protein kinase